LHSIHDQPDADSVVAQCDLARSRTTPPATRTPRRRQAPWHHRHWPP